jgi:hypothetical protein
MSRTATKSKIWKLADEDVREMADEIGIPTNMPVPDVALVNKDDLDKVARDYPCLFTNPDEPSGFVITIPKRMLAKFSAKKYVIGDRARENIKHELAHYIEHVEQGTTTGREDDPYQAALKEIRADIRARRKSMPRCLAIVIRTLVREYGLNEKEACDVVARAANDLGVDSKVVNLGKKRYREDRI